MTKVIANRLKLFLNDLVASNQSSFIPGRQSIDNVIIRQEIIHSLKYTQSKKGGMVLKIDLEKAHDMLEWDFCRRHSERCFSALKHCGHDYEYHTSKLV